MHENMNVQPSEYLCPKIAGTNLAYIEDDKQKLDVQLHTMYTHFRHPCFKFNFEEFLCYAGSYISLTY